MSCISKKPTRKPSFYFAYGSNLHLAQMAQRCPGSKFVGKATLSGYEWQIYSRGVANVIKSGTDYPSRDFFTLLTAKTRNAWIVLKA